MRIWFVVALGLLVLAGWLFLASRPASPHPWMKPLPEGDGVSATDRMIGALQERLRQQPSAAASATRLGLAYLQRARETSDPSSYTRADDALQQAYSQTPEDADT